MNTMSGQIRACRFLALAVLACCMGGCKNPTGPSGQPTPTPVAPVPPDVLWQNGTIGTWFTNTLTLACNTNGTYNSVVATDNVTGDTTSLQVSGTSVGLYFSSPNAVSVSDFSSGHIQFDIELEQNIAGNLTIYYGATSQSECYSYLVSLSSLSTGSFTHVSIPISFTNPCGENIAGPFYAVFPSTSSGPVADFGNIRWTSN
jgi:hypothetical protein